METLTAGDDDVFAHSSRKKSRGVSAGGHTTTLDVPGTQVDELRRTRKQEKKMIKRRMEEEEYKEEEEECKKRKKKKKKKKEEEMVVVIDEEEDEREADSKAPVVIETSVTKKKKKHKRGTAEGRVAVETVDNNGRDPAGVPSDKSKKPDRKTDTSAVVTAVTTDCDTPDTALSQEGPWREAGAGGTLPGVSLLRKGRKSRKKELDMAQKEKLESGENMKLLAELLMYVPNVGSRSPEIIQRMLLHDLLRYSGIELRSGRFLKQENLKIHENVTNFLALTGISTCNQLFFPERYPELTVDIKKLPEDIPRACYAVYARGKKIYDDLNYLGRFTEDEDRQLKKLQRIHGNDWKIIGKGMDRSTNSIQKRFNVIKNQPGSGSAPEPPWLTKKQLYSKLPWKAISEKVACRSWLQCREKWFCFLKGKLEICRMGRKCHGVLPKIQLINTLYGMELEDPAEIDWEQVANCLGDHVTPYSAQKLFNCLKMTSVPHLLKMKKSERDFQPLQQVEGQDKYLLSDILRQDDFVELDNTR
ncbi:hypothetical protein CRUP_033490 [Coryphaenoides rupestris]|nr:hypothetical protein CRUP_033490 [Coryphaenoides rupestris]